jgi:predicted permease
MGSVLIAVVELVLMIALGFGLTKARMISGEGRRVLTDLVIYVTQPLLVIHSFQMDYDPKMLGNFAVVAVFAAVSLAAFYGLSLAAWPKGDEGKRRVFRHAMVFCNCGFMGYPVMQSVFGPIGVVYASVYGMVYTVFLWTLGIYIYAGKSGTWKQVLLQPGLIAVVVGLLLFVFGVRLPSFLGDTVSGLGSCTTPLAMLVIGALVADGDFSNLFKDWTILSTAAARNIALPALALGVMWVLRIAGVDIQLSSPVMQSCILLTAMPIGANVAIFASMYNVKPHYAAQSMLVSTVLCVATLPVWIFILKLL